MARVVAVSLGILGLAIAIACGDAYQGQEAPIDAGVDADITTEAGAGPTDPCAHAAPVGPPAVDDAPANELTPFVLAIDSLALTTVATPGFDLDGTCTCDGRAGGAHDAGPSCGSPTKDPTCDLEGGVDNALANIASSLGAFYPVDTIPNNLIKQGRRTMLVQIAKYNGTANDKDVAVGLIVSEGIREPGCPTSTLGEDGNYTPGHCGDDHWSVKPDTVLSGGPTGFIPAIVGTGYVADWRLVVRYTSSASLAFTEEYTITLANGISVGKLVPLGEDLMPRDPTRAPTEREKRLWRIEEGIVGGRLDAQQMLAALGNLRPPGVPDAGTARLCTSAGFSFFRQTVCNARDIARSQALDFDPQFACDALSAAVHYTAEPSLTGGMFDNTPETVDCSPGVNGDPVDAAAGTYRCP